MFHYEFEFIHPFADGNGRMGRLWQSLILGKLHPLFEHLPVENMVFSNQQAYYDAITASTQAADSGVFIDFMLSEILETLKRHQGEELHEVHDKVHDKHPDISDSAWNVLNYLSNNDGASAKMAAEALGMSERMVRKHIATLKSANILSRAGSNKYGKWIVRWE